MSALGTGPFADRLVEFMSGLTARAALAVSPRPARQVLVAPGESVAWDDCCAGQVWTRLDSLEPTGDPSRTPGLHVCAVPEFLGTFELGIIRCAAVVDDHGRAPSPGQIDADGRQSIRDMSALLGVLRCTPDLRSLGAWTPRGPEGGCHGGTWTFTMRVPNCLGCEEG